MAIKTKQDPKTEQAENQAPNQTESTTQNVSTTPATAPENGSATKRRGPAPGVPRGPMSTPGVWEEGGDETRDKRDLAMFAILKAERSPGAIRTAESVAQALSRDAELFPRGIKPFDVSSRIRVWNKEFEKKEQTPPSWLQLDVSKGKPSVNLDLFA